MWPRTFSGSVWFRAQTSGSATVRGPRSVRGTGESLCVLWRVPFEFAATTTHEDGTGDARCVQGWRTFIRDHTARWRRADRRGRRPSEAAAMLITVVTSLRRRWHPMVAVVSPPPSGCADRILSRMPGPTGWTDRANVERAADHSTAGAGEPVRPVSPVLGPVKVSGLWRPGRRVGRRARTGGR